MKQAASNENLYWYLLRVAITAKHGLMRIADLHGLSVMQLYTLCLLEDSTSIPMNSLSCMLSCDASNITGIVDRLLHQGYIHRQENPNDRRLKMITLTPEGAKLCQKISAQLRLCEPAGLDAISADEKTHLMKSLEKILASTAAKTKSS